MCEFNLNYPGSENQQVQRSIASGQILFLVGANGTGKSTLMYHFANQNSGKVRRITAHRQVWFNTDSIDITPAARQQTEKNMINVDRQVQSRWKDEYASQRSQVTIFDLIDSENVEARKIADAARSGQMEIVKILAAAQSPIAKMNDILRMANLDFQVKVEMGSKLIAERKGYPFYSIAELSDGERNALLIIANVLTAPEDTLILLDEPERHLHRSIVSPLLSTLLTYRSDCAFVISTHDVSLPLDQRKASSLLLRSYSHEPKNWVADYIDAVEDLDEIAASAILGSRKTILFIEGRPSSLDAQLYQILFPNISVRPVGSCVEVERIVKGLRSSATSHWVSAIGIIDRDNRSDDECARFKGNGIAALEQYSVESIYYHPIVIDGVLKRGSQVNGIDTLQATELYTSRVVESMGEHKERMAARLVEKKIKDKVQYESPNWKQILDNKPQVIISSEELLEKEKQLIERLLDKRDISRLIARYPIRETPSLGLIANSLGFLSQDMYEQSVRKMLCDSDTEKQKVLGIIRPVVDLLSNDAT